jgi:hypothetical protein
MSTEGTNAPIVAAKTTVAAEQASERQNSKRMGEGLSVFRGLLIMALFYAAFGFLLWFAWHALKHSHSH